MDERARGEKGLSGGKSGKGVWVGRELEAKEDNKEERRRMRTAKS